MLNWDLCRIIVIELCMGIVRSCVVYRDKLGVHLYFCREISWEFY